MVVEKKLQCKVQKLHKDRDFVQFRKKVYRIPKVVKRRFTTNTPDIRVVDPQFDMLNLEFKRLKRLVACLLKSCECYSISTYSFVDSSLALSKVFGSVLNCSPQWDRTQLAMSPTWSFKDSSVDLMQPQGSPLEPISKRGNFGANKSTAGGRNLSRKARSRENSIRGQIKAELEMFNQNLTGPLVLLHKLFTQIGRVLKERRLCMIDLATCTSKYRYLSSKLRRPLKPRQLRKKMRYERDLELEKLKYDSLTTAIKVESRVLFTLFRTFFENWTANYLLTTCSVAQILCDELACGAERSPRAELTVKGPLESVRYCVSLDQAVSLHFDEPKKSSEGAEFVADTSESINRIVTQFQSEFGVVEEQLAKLELIKFEASSYAAPEKSYMLHVTAMYDYTQADPGFNIGDLPFSSGDLIKVILKDDSGWWYGVHCTTKERGVFPANYVKMV
ncbi:LAFA_0G13322g1_1 [Lachancea sp. 'fantastica']|nr:LAFA_0G13322g1_1 [Lachancea sp. 'fantastica']